MTRSNKLLILISQLIIIACSYPGHRSLPQPLVSSVEVSLGDSLRFWGDEDDFLRKLIELERVRHRQETSGLIYDEHGQRRVANYLALSGGGTGGAFGAGVLNAWSDLGTRPIFDVVTGISTGAIISVFAYLGSEYDHFLERFYTEIGDEQLYRKRLLSAFSKGSLLNIQRFEDLVRDTIDATVISEVGEAYSNGRLLFIGTTNLETQRLVIWDMGKIASLGTAEAQRLFQNIVIASSSIPGVFPPVQLEVEYRGKLYDELHVDGGISRQVFLFPDSWDFSSISSVLGEQERRVYVIRNDEFVPKWQSVPIGISAITIRSILTLIKYQGRGDVLRIYQQSQDAKMDFNLAYIGLEFNEKPRKGRPFDEDYMAKLFQYGYSRAIGHQVWKSEPPEFDTLFLPELFIDE
ncbi:patatin-like phospholipase family protein [Aliagarivorans marinus]|uniref:patatin-like phospholipase family protein n=1 Tax=Aliagarivorans marinus TaxID=561965 RepID=UPI0004102A7E|nr:patatin-like phospholipase family protein [Aliagarivorans marinus]